MTTRKNDIASRFIFIALLVISSFAGTLVFGQDAEELFKKYKNEQAVFTSVKELMEIKNENGVLVATSNISRERMLIGDLSPGIYNKEYIFHSYFNRLTDYEEEALVFGENGYKKQKNFTSRTINSDQDNVFYDDIKQTEITFNGLTPRSIIKTNYNISHTDLHMLPTFYFERNLPVANVTFELTAPKYVQLKFVIKGSASGKIKQSVEENKHTITYRFTATDLPAESDYNDVPGSLWHVLQVVPYITSYTLPGKEPTEMLSDPAHLYYYYYNYIRNINVTEDEELNKTVAEIIKGDNTQKEKAAHIYKWVQQKIYYIAFEDSLEGFIPRQAADICKRKFGDCKDMASILVAMCRKAGIEAHFAWIGTRSKPYTYEETPLPIVDNHMICLIKIGDEWLFLDGTHPVIPFGEIPSNLQDKQAMVAIDEKNFKIIKVPETDGAKNVTVDSTYMQVNGNKTTGKIAINYAGYPSWDLQILMMYNHNKDRDAIFKDLCSRGSNKFSGTKYEFYQSDTGYKNCRIGAEFSVDDYVRKLDKEYYVNMNLKRYFETHHIDTEGRDVPHFFKYKDVIREVVKLEIPAGFHVSYLPPEASGVIKDVWEYRLKYYVEGRYVILSKEYKNWSLTIPVKDFVAHNKLIDQLKNQYKETVVLAAD